MLFATSSYKGSALYYCLYSLCRQARDFARSLSKEGKGHRCCGHERCCMGRRAAAHSANQSRRAYRPPHVSHRPCSSSCAACSNYNATHFLHLFPSVLTIFKSSQPALLTMHCYCPPPAEPIYKQACQAEIHFIALLPLCRHNSLRFFLLRSY